MRFLIIILLFSSFSFSQEAVIQFEQANQFYRSGEFTRAAQMYDLVVKNGFESSELYYNLGNSYFKLQNIPASILNFERAKKFSPNDEDINYNLRLANLRVVDKIEPMPRLFFLNWWSSFMNLLSSDGWSIVGIILIWICAASGSLIFISRSITMQRIMFIITFIALISSAVAFIGIFQRHNIEQNEQWAIVFTQSVPVKSAPDKQSTDLFILHEGVKVEFLDAVGEWRKIRLADGKIGWLPSGDVQII
jgi:tetratricopeptide (TPR) repeat protein